MSKPRVPQRAWQALMQASPEEGVQPLKDAKRINIDLIHPDPRQPRKHFDEAAMAELVASVEQRGILQPITVQKRPAGGYFVVTGERRLRAARTVGLETVPALVVDLSETELRLDRVIENRQRQDLSDLEFARAITEIRNDLATQAPNLSSNELDDLVGQRLGLAGRTVRSFAAVLNLDPAIEALLGEKLTELRTRGLARVAYDRALQLALAQAILDHDLSGRQTLAIAQLLKRNLGLAVAEAVQQVLGRGAAPPAGPVEPAPPASDEDTDQDTLESHFDPADPARRYWLLTTYLSRAGAILAEPGADEEVPLSRGQVGDLARLLEPLVRLYATLQPAIEYIQRKREAGDDGYEGEPLPHHLALMLPYGRAPETPARGLHAVRGGAGKGAQRPAARAKDAARLTPVPKRRSASSESAE
ncbi:MAG TPA: ParB/RepB/Spo0J family partition protein [Chloroflexia bacterium]|nr:ParB/RepB/Spo0J family partition protein [Chloroflexia bacterium]